LTLTKKIEEDAIHRTAVGQAARVVKNAMGLREELLLVGEGAGGDCAEVISCNLP
jgi:hypothetical protein